jgi:hypothetical protein
MKDEYYRFKNSNSTTLMHFIYKRVPPPPNADNTDVCYYGIVIKEVEMVNCGFSDSEQMTRTATPILKEHSTKLTEEELFLELI